MNPDRTPIEAWNGMTSAIWAAHDGELGQQIRSTAIAAERAEDDLDEALAKLPPT